MEIIVVKNTKELGEVVSDIFAEVIIKKNSEGKDAVLGLATGSTPIPIYEELVKRHSEGKIDFQNTITFNLDEYVDIDYSNENSYHKFMETNLFNNININKEKTNFPDGNSSDLKQEVSSYEKKIKDAGGIDLQILGIGENGHIAFNEPSENLSLETNVVNLTESTIQANARFFNSPEEVPKQALSMGMGTILSANKIVLIATGLKKKEAVKHLILDNQITTKCPATLLKLHKDVTVIVDEELYNEINK